MLTYEYYVVVKTVLKCLQVVNPGVILGSDVFDEKVKISTMLKKKIIYLQYSYVVYVRRILRMAFTSVVAISTSA